MEMAARQMLTRPSIWGPTLRSASLRSAHPKSSETNHFSRFFPKNVLPTPPNFFVEVSSLFVLSLTLKTMATAALRKRARSERKYFTSYANPATAFAGTTWAGKEMDPATLDTLFCPTRGADITNRVGREVTVHSMKMWLVAGDVNHVRLIIYVDRQPNGAQSQAEEVMESAAVDGIIKATGFQNTANLGRFKVLYDEIVNPRVDNNVGYQLYKVKIKLDPVTVRFNDGNTGTIADITSNAFHAIGCTAYGTGNVLTYYTTRFSFTDA